MQDECNALELELKHHEKEFAELVSEELEQRFMRFEEVTLAAVQKAIGIINAPAAGATANWPLLHHSLAVWNSADPYAPLNDLKCWHSIVRVYDVLYSRECKVGVVTE